MVVVIDTEKAVPSMELVEKKRPLKSIVSDRCRTLISEFREFGSKTFAGLLALGKTVVAAKVELSPNEYKYFAQQVGFKPDSPTLRKFELIGRNAKKLEALGDRLPNKWTTLYMIASFAPEQLQLLSEHQDFGRDITAQKVRQIVFPKPVKVQEEPIGIPPLEAEVLEFARLSFSNVVERQQLFEEIEDLQKRFRCGCVWTLANGIEIFRFAKDVSAEPSE